MLVRKLLINNYKDALREVQKTGCDMRAEALLAKKGFQTSVFIGKIDNRAANILKQDAISCGADAAVSENVSRFKKGFSSVVIFASAKQLELLVKKLYCQPFNLKELAFEIEKILRQSFEEKKIFRYKKNKIVFSETAVMGIINLDPDSFSGDGFTDVDAAVEKAVMFEKSGAKIIDVGAESSRPASKPIDSKTEIKRLIPFLKKVKRAVKIPISVDTYKYETSKAVLSEGADIINDIFALRKGGEKLAKLIADTKAGLILMHMKGVPSNMQKKPSYKDCVGEVFEFLKERKDFALSFGIGNDFISVDPGCGFGKTVANNIELVKNMGVFSSLGVVTAGVSRKSFVRTLSSANIHSFVSANLTCAFFGADIIRTHDVAETVCALKISDAARRA